VKYWMFTLLWHKEPTHHKQKIRLHKPSVVKRYKLPPQNDNNIKAMISFKKKTLSHIFYFEYD